MAESEVTRELRVNLTEAQVNERARRSAALVGEVLALQDEKKTTAKFFAARIDEKQDTIKKISLAISNGWELSQVPCRVRLDSPQPGWKTIYRLDNYEVVDTEAMTDEERQRPLEYGPSGESGPDPEPEPQPEPEPEPATEQTTAAIDPLPLYDPNEKCPTCNGACTLCGGALTCPDCLGVGQKRIS